VGIQFGRWSFDCRPCAPDYLTKVNASLAPYGHDSDESYSKDGTNILYRAFHTTTEAHTETQPHISSSGIIIIWDGRLDNRDELSRDLRPDLIKGSSDLAIVAAAYEQWDTGCFAKLIGDWALSIWSPKNRFLILAKDPIGTRHLYYSFNKDQISWSTILDPLVLFSGKTFSICEEYIAGWFSYFPAVHLTPYDGIHAVPPSSFVFVRPCGQTIRKYWDFDPSKRIRYPRDADYEAHFRSVFAQAIQRRLRSNRPILAELSGGMDSSAIVCMADTIVAGGSAETPRLDTVSWYYDFDPALDERPYIGKVEAKRGRKGWHINASASCGDEPQQPFASEFEDDQFAATPDSARRPDEHFKQYAAYIESQGIRVVLSGIGGEEATGGNAPTPTPELQDLLARARLFALVRQLNAWAAKMRKARFPLLWEAIRGFFPLAFTGAPKETNAARWFRLAFVDRNRAPLSRYPTRVKLFGPLPSFQDHIAGLDVLRRLVAYDGLRSHLLCDVRYPYLDRDLLEFAFAIPREQMVRVGQRRSLMKRALAGIVPDELLSRRKIAPASQNRSEDRSTEWPTPTGIVQLAGSAFTEIVELDHFLRALEKARRNEDVPISRLGRILTLESWLHHLTINGVLATPTLRTIPDPSSSFATEKVSRARSA
jgi:asparagine synthase (glutamine-hydrolysing)